MYGSTNDPTAYDSIRHLLYIPNPSLSLLCKVNLALIISKGFLESDYLHDKLQCCLKI